MYLKPAFKSGFFAAVNADVRNGFTLFRDIARTVWFSHLYQLRTDGASAGAGDPVV